MFTNLQAALFYRIFMEEYFCTLLEISLSLIAKYPVENKPPSVQVMTWRGTDD